MAMTTTIDLLSMQHQDVLAQLRAVEAEILPRKDADLAEFAAYLADEVACHFALEEQALFPSLARHLSLAHGPLAVMNAEHADFREALAGLTAALHGADLTAQHTHAAQLIQLLRTHIAKEDHVLFPMAARLLSAAEQDEVDRCAAVLSVSPPALHA
jgi:hemerythrin-like domain-containing protein